MALAVAVACFCSAVLAASASAAAGTGRISGEVTDASTLAAVAGVEVCAEATSEESYGCEVTDSQGKYEIVELGTGNYKVEFRPPQGPLDYVPQYYDGKPSWQQASLVHVTNGLLTSGVDAALTRGGWIEGRVTDAVTKAGLAEVFVCAIPIAEEGFGRCGSTNSLGNYTLHGLPADSYGVEFFPEDGDHLFQAYKGKANWYEATPVTVTAGAGTAAIDAELGQAGHIAGTVTDAASGAGIPFVPVCLVDAKGEPEVCVRAGSAGRYSFDGLPSGAYRVRFSPDHLWPEEEDDYVEQYYNGESSSSQADLVVVTAPDTTSGIDAHLVSRKARPGSPPASGSQGPPTATQAPKPKKRSCRRGFRRVTAHGKSRCVKVHRHHRRHRHRGKH